MLPGFSTSATFEALCFRNGAKCR